MDPSDELGNITKTIVLVGAGKMGAALLQGWLVRGLDPAKLAVLEPQPADDIKALAARGVQINPSNKVADAGAIVIAVKPQVADSVVPTLAPIAGTSTVAVSIMAGKTLGF